MKLVATPGGAAILALLLLATVLAGPATSQEGFSNGDANACLDCHETPYVMGILQTAHADVKDPKSPAAQKQCQSCHGPSAKHMKFPMQVENVHFGKQSKAAPEVQNEACLECHHDGDREQWNASAHGFEKVVCSTCHVSHEPDKVVPANHTVVGGCTAEACHADLMEKSKPEDFSHALGKKLGEGDQAELSCAGCHNPHGPLASGRCIECHPQTQEVLAKESEKAKRFHEVATRKGTECIRCHKAIAHPIPKPILDEMMEEMYQSLGE